MEKNAYYLVTMVITYANLVVWVSLLILLIVNALAPEIKLCKKQHVKTI